MFKDQLSLALQYCLPHRWISSFAGWMANSKQVRLKSFLIRWFIGRFGVDMKDSLRSESEFTCFNDFFTRHLHPHSRVIDQNPGVLTSPCDGTVLEAGPLSPQAVLHAKGHPFDLKSLLGPGDHALNDLSNGQYATLYLSPKDYHRVHMPCTGRLEKTTYIPGKLFSVSPFVVNHVPQVFARNERLVCHFSTDHGPLILIFVGAMIVSGIKTVWDNQTKLTSALQVKTTSYSSDNLLFQKGQEIGHFELGSTVILLCPWQSFQFKLHPKQKLMMGQKVGQFS